MRYYSNSNTISAWYSGGEHSSVNRFKRMYRHQAGIAIGSLPQHSNGVKWAEWVESVQSGWSQDNVGGVRAH